MPRSNYISSFITVVLIIMIRLVSIIGQPSPSTNHFPPELLGLDLATRLRVDQQAITLASTDYGNLIQSLPAAVLYPSSHHDISTLIKASYSSRHPFSITARGHGHSTHAQSLSHNGVIIHMRSLNHNEKDVRINVSSTPTYYYADVGAEQLWIDVLHATLKHGLAPLSWTDYLYLTVGGTLSNAGISGQAFRHGPQINNVYEMDVVTGIGEIVTCSKRVNSDLFYGVLGGLGQFGIITRARIALGPAPSRVRWIRLLYGDVKAFTRDQEYLISMDGRDGKEGFDYVEGSLISDESRIDDWRSSFFSAKDHQTICSLATQHPMIYSLEVVKYYNNVTRFSVRQDVDLLLKGLNFIPGFAFEIDVSYIDFLNRVHDEELTLRSKGLWDVPHPWLNLFLPKSRILDFDAGVFKGILKQNASTGPILVYPMNKNKWDEKMSAVTPDEDIFYTVGLLRSATKNNWESLEDQNREILRFCDDAGIEIKQYLPHYETSDEWKKHFGPKWDDFSERKRKFDPKGILAPGQMIFSTKHWEASPNENCC